MKMRAEAVSLVIRAWNEAPQLECLLHSVMRQDYAGDVELVVVDSGSVDGTAEIAKRAGAKVVRLSQAEFSYPGSLNKGFQAATHSLVAEVVAHALPIDIHWLSNGVRHFGDPKVAGVYGGIRAMPGASAAEQVQYFGYWSDRLRGVQRVRRAAMGVMGATNMIIRRSVWEEHPFDERFGMGGEDEVWAAWALSAGYTIIRDPGFAVYHSHGLKAPGAIRQFLFWRRLKQPRPFDQSVLGAFRPDIARKAKLTDQ